MRSVAIYFVVLGICCLVFPPMLGFVTGVGGFCLLWWCFYKMLGG